MIKATAALAPSSAGPHPTHTRGRWRKCAWVAGIAVGLASLLFLSRAPLLRGAAHAWVVDEPVERADAVIALPQCSGKPVVEAARLHRELGGVKVVMTSAAQRPTDRLGLTTPFDQQNRRLMRELGVPEADFQIVGESVPTLHAAAQAIAGWAKAQQLHSVLVVTEQFPSRRVKWALERALRPLGVTVRLRAVPVPDFDLDTWWRQEQGLIHFENEVVLHTFYRLNY